MSEFSSDRSAQQIDEVSGDISTVDEELIGTEESRSLTEFPDRSYLSLIVENVMHDEISVEG